MSAMKPDSAKEDTFVRDNRDKRMVWDLPLRVFHWVLVLSIAASWATAKIGFEWMEIHFLLGYWTAGLIIFRIIWGFVGPKYARFSSFLPSPKAVLNYLRGFRNPKSKQSVGHNPVGALMVFAILGVLNFQVATGLFATDDILFSGPYSGVVKGKTAELLTRLHNFNFDVILGLVFMHILAVFVYLFRKKQNLILPMITGRKSKDVVSEDEAIKHSRILIALCVCIFAGLVVWGLVGLAPVSEDSFY